MDQQPPDHPSRVVLDSASLRAIAHPLRMRILGRLRKEGPATATRLAARLGTNSGTTSYHLRKLADVGLVEEDAESGDGRDRWWRAAHEFTSWSQEQFRDDPDDRAAADWLIGYHLRVNTEQTQGWLDGQADWPAEWLRHADLSDYRLFLTADQLEALGRELHEVIQRYHQAGEAAVAAGEAPLPPGAAPADGSGRVPVTVILHLHPDVRG